MYSSSDGVLCFLMFMLKIIFRFLPHFIHGQDMSQLLDVLTINTHVGCQNNAYRYKHIFGDDIIAHPCEVAVLFEIVWEDNNFIF